MPARVPVTAVLVAHDGSRWLPAALSALASSTVTPARLIAVDTGSTDDGAALLRGAADLVLTLPRTTGYAAAVHAALAAVPADSRWVWLLHDDAAPDRDALSALLRAAAAAPSAAVLGPKVVDWDDPRVLVEIGCSTDLFGVRDSGVEPGELDQGQYDGTRPVLAVGTAGALVRRDVWDALGGLDPALPLFGGDLDLGWRAGAAGHQVLVVPRARLRHARAASTGRREIDCSAGTPAFADRRAAIFVLLAHRRQPVLLWLALVLTGLVRAAAALLVRQPCAAWSELTAPLAQDPRAVRRARRARATTRTTPPAAQAALLASPWRRVRSRLERAPREPLRWRRRSPGFLLTLALAAVTLLATRSLIGRGDLVGGRLLAAPADLWSAYADGRDPFLALLAAAATVLLGQADLAVDLLLLGGVPAAGAVAFSVVREVVRSRLLQVWAAVTWAMLPTVTGAVAAGRLEAVAVHVALPALLLVGHRFTARAQPLHRAVALGLALTLAVAAAPVLWPLALVVLLGSALVRLAAAAPAQRADARRRTGGAAAALVLPPVLLLPWSPQLLDARALLHGSGRVGPDLADPALPAWHLLLLQPGGPGTPATWLAVGVLLAGLGGLLRARRARVAAAGWGLALLGLAAALVLARTTVDGVPVWPGVPLDLAAAGLLLAALIGGEGLQQGLSRASFGARQLAAVGVVAVAVLAPVAGGLDWIRRGADGPVERTDRQPLPAFVQAELRAQPGTRALLLSTRRDGVVAYRVVGPDGPRLGSRPVRLDDLVADLLTSQGATAAEAAAAQGITFVLAGDDLPALDAQPGLSRQPGDTPLWRVAARPTPARDADPAGLPLWLQAVALSVAAVLAGPGATRKT